MACRLLLQFSCLLPSSLISVFTTVVKIYIQADGFEGIHIIFISFVLNISSVQNDVGEFNSFLLILSLAKLPPSYYV